MRPRSRVYPRFVLLAFYKLRLIDTLSFQENRPFSSNLQIKSKLMEIRVRQIF